MPTYPISYQPIIFAFSSIIQLTPNEIQGLIDRIDIIRYKKQQHLLVEGEICNGIFFLNYGFCRLYQNSNNIEKIIHFAGQYDFTTNIEGMLLGIPSPVYIQALEETEVVYIPHSTLQWTANTITSGAKLIRVLWERYTIQEMGKIYTRYTIDPLERYQHLLACFPTINQLISQKYIASYLNITPEYLSQLKAKHVNTIRQNLAVNKKL